MLLALYLQNSIWENSGSRVTSLSAQNQGDCMILKPAISKKKLTNQLDFWHAYTDSRNIIGGL